MCRQNQVWGIALIAFGLGILIGTWVEGGFLCHCLGFGLFVGGLGLLRKK